MKHKAGFVSIVGKPNVGKSTLMNALVGECLSIVTAKAQTTRHRILGIISGSDFQIVYSDTPGVITPKYRLQESMMHFVRSALSDADLILYVTEVGAETPNAEFIDAIRKPDKPLIVVLNKVDLATQAQISLEIERWTALIPEQKGVFPVSALHLFNTKKVMEEVLHNLPEHPAFFDKNQLTDKSQRFFASEIIREKILLNYAQEIPYACEVVIIAFKEMEKIIRISAEILVERESQKGIVIGKKGSMLKKVGMEARKAMETFFGKKVFLEQFVKVEPNWRKKEDKLNRLGYLR